MPVVHFALRLEGLEDRSLVGPCGDLEPTDLQGEISSVCRAGQSQRLVQALAVAVRVVRLEEVSTPGSRRTFAGSARSGAALGRGEPDVPFQAVNQRPRW
jgi:hypothetical protein